MYLFLFVNIMLFLKVRINILYNFCNVNYSQIFNIQVSACGDKAKTVALAESINMQE